MGHMHSLKIKNLLQHFEVLDILEHQFLWDFQGMCVCGEQKPLTNIKENISSF